MYNVVQDDCKMQMIEFGRALQTGQPIAMHPHRSDSVVLTYPSYPLGMAAAELLTIASLAGIFLPCVDTVDNQFLFFPERVPSSNLVIRQSFWCNVYYK